LKSVELYTEALSRVRHWTTLYTNRAQAHLRLQNFEVMFLLVLCPCFTFFAFFKICFVVFV